MGLTGKCCDNGSFDVPHDCQKQPGRDPAALMRAEKELEHMAGTTCGQCQHPEEKGLHTCPRLRPDSMSTFHMKADGVYKNGELMGEPVNVVIDGSGSADKRRGYVMEEGKQVEVNGAGVPLAKLRQSPGRPKGARNLNAKHPSSIAKAFRKAGLDWQTDFALAIKANNRNRIKLWLRLLPYLVTTTNTVRVKKWKGKASKAALIALDALEGKR